MEAEEIVSAQVSGLEFRRLRAEDAPAIESIHVRRVERDGVDPLSTFESIPTLDQVVGWIGDRTAAGTIDTILAAAVDGRVVGFTWLDWWREKDGARIYLSQAAVDPEYRGLGIGSSMLGWAEEKLRSVAIGEGGFQDAYYGANATETEVDATGLLTDAGYTRRFSVIEMERADLDGIGSICQTGSSSGRLRRATCWRSADPLRRLTRSRFTRMRTRRIRMRRRSGG